MAVAMEVQGSRRWTRFIPIVVLVLFTLPILILYTWLLYSSFFPRMEGLRPIGAFTLDNWRFLWAQDTIDSMRNRPPLLPLTLNTFIFALGTAGVVLLLSSMAGLRASRIRFPARRTFLGSVLLLHSFPAVSLLIATFIVLRSRPYDQLIGVILVKATFELPFGIWIMKGFFDTVPWDLEMAALVDGAGRSGPGGGW